MYLHHLASIKNRLNNYETILKTIHLAGSKSIQKKTATGVEIQIFHGWVVLAAEFASPLDNVLDKALQCEHPLNRWTKGPKWMGIGMPPLSNTKTGSNTTPGWRVRVYLDIIESQRTLLESC